MRIAHISDFHLRHHLPGAGLNTKRCARKMLEPNRCIDRRGEGLADSISAAADHTREAG